MASAFAVSHSTPRDDRQVMRRSGEPALLCAPSVV